MTVLLPFPMPNDTLFGADETGEIRRDPRTVIASVEYRDEPTVIALVLLLNRASPFFTVAHYYQEACPAEGDAPARPTGYLHELVEEYNIVHAVREYEQSGGDV